MSEDDANPSGEPAAEEPKPQFGLRALLVFVFLCGLYFSQFRFVDLLTYGADLDATAAATIWLGWFAFGWFYRSQRLYEVQVLHCFVYVLFVMGGIVLAIAMLFEGWSTGFSEFGERGWGFIVVGARIGLISNLVSFPAGVLMLLVKAFKPTRELRL